LPLVEEAEGIDNEIGEFRSFRSFRCSPLLESDSAASREREDLNRQDAKVAVLALPSVVGRLADAVLAANLGDLQAAVGFLEDRHDLAL
jgi:hypothetical protein